MLPGGGECQLGDTHNVSMGLHLSPVAWCVAVGRCFRHSSVSFIHKRVQSWFSSQSLGLSQRLNEVMFEVLVPPGSW